MTLSVIKAVTDKEIALFLRIIHEYLNDTIEFINRPENRTRLALQTR